MKAIEQYFHVALFIMLHKIAPSLTSVDDCAVLSCGTVYYAAQDRSKSYVCGTVYFAVQGGSNFKVCG